MRCAVTRRRCYELEMTGERQCYGTTLTNFELTSAVKLTAGLNRVPGAFCQWDSIMALVLQLLELPEVTLPLCFRTHPAWFRLIFRNSRLLQMGIHLFALQQWQPLSFVVSPSHQVSYSWTAQIMNKCTSTDTKISPHQKNQTSPISKAWTKCLILTMWKQL